MKLLQINTVSSYSSTGRITDGIGRRAISEGWKSYIAYGRKQDESTSETYRVGNLLDNYIHVFESRFFDRQGLSSRSATKKFVDWIKSVDPSIIQLHNLHGYYLNLPILFDYLSTLDIPVVMSLHDTWNFTGHCAQFVEVGCTKWKTNCQKCPLTQDYPKSFFVDRSFKNHQMKKKYFLSVRNLHLVTSSNWSADLIRQSFLKEKPIDIIPNGVDLTAFSPKGNKNLETKYDIKDKFIILGVAAIWQKSKGYEDFIELSKHLNHDERIVMIGMNDKQLQSLPDNIIGIKRTESLEELAEWYSIADVFMNLTYADTFPTTNLEALACGTPVVTYETGGSVESVTEKTGYVVKQGDIQKLVTIIETMKSKPKDSYKSASRAFAEEHYDKDKQFYEYIKLYNNLHKK